MKQQSLNLGGEQSGHIVMSDFGTTGDGLVAALQILAVLIKNAQPVSELCNKFTPYPQMLKNVKYAAGTDPLSFDHVQEAIKEGESRLDGTGRVVIRKSGTEPVIRVMAEGQDEGLVENVIDDIIAAIESEDVKPQESKEETAA